ncbi:Uncharacterized membrane protein [Amycolatopsis marina]|uniref:Uncharacterized membrane protein n=1 Tax=Amycolatopsis marina TaxID=490629 RepID=A0A1I1AS62_9PSEU|nr:DUF1622 domain-containing protein [Amycolatopsis marina]SFB40871.1 Uncharacterized membrane protein [Amycolatopsis marina]
MDFQHAVETVGKSIETVGIAVIVVGAVTATVLAAMNWRRGATDIYRRYRRQLGRSILLGLEFLVAGDIIRTVAVEPTFTSVGVLAGIVLIRTFLSFSLELEITGRWPWQERRQQPTARPHGIAASPPDG